MFKQFFTLFLAVLFFSHAEAQILQPVKWESSVSPGGVLNEYTLIFKGVVDEGWKIYSHNIPENGPIPTTIFYDNIPDGLELVGEMEELGRMEEEIEPLFENKLIKFYHKKIILKQKVKITKNVTLKGYVEYMTCNDRQCTPPTNFDFSFDLAASTNLYTGEGSADYSKIKKPVTWIVTPEKISDTEYLLNFKANIAPTWKLYSQNSPEGGAQAMQFNFEGAGTNYTLIGKVVESGNLEKKAEPLFKNKVLLYYHDQASMSQKIRIDSANAVISGYVDYQTCDATQCMYDQQDFSFRLSGGEIIEIIETDSSTGLMPVNVFGDFKVDTAYARQGNCDLQLNQTITDAGNKSLWSTFILGFIGGLIGLLMPCTFPMIPFTISFFTKRSTKRSKGIFEASFYGFSIILVYFLASLPFLFFGLSGDKLNEFSTNNVVNMVFFFVFIFFALSLFGLFEIKLPSKWANKADSASDVGGLMGIFFMALTLCIVSFSCTGPILGSLLANSLKDGGAALSAGMIGFGLAFALAFTLLALFPQLLNKLPKSGGWLNEVKIVFAFIELAFAIKFLSNTDLAYHWGILKREVFLGFWALLSLLTFLYLIGVIRFPHDDKKVKISIPRGVFALTFLSLAIYFGSGLQKGKNLALISGFTPPMFYSVYHYDNECPLALNCFHDMDEAIAYAKEQNKPIMIDFTGWACVNCRKMEEHVWPDDNVYKLINEQYVLVSLYVDDKKSLQLEDQYISSHTGNKVRSIGNKWSDFQARDFGTNSQPYYVLIAPDGKVLTQPRGYTPDKEEYQGFLECGIETFKSIGAIADVEAKTK